MKMTNFYKIRSLVRTKATELATINNSFYKKGDEKIIYEILSMSFISGGLPYMQRIATRVFYVGKNYEDANVKLEKLKEELALGR